VAHCKQPDLPFHERKAFTFGEVAALLGVSIATLYSERARGKLRTIRLAGRRLVLAQDLDEYIAAASREASRQ
jgi:excisionase family DNA binding protein